MGRKIHRDETIIEPLSHEIAILKRHKSAKRSEQISPAQGSLLDDLLNTDLEAIDAELKALRPAPAPDEIRQQPSREHDQAVGAWSLELALRRIAARRQAGGGNHEVVQSARMNGHAPYTYLKDVLTRLPTLRASDIAQLLPRHNEWLAVRTCAVLRLEGDMPIPDRIRQILHAVDELDHTPPAV